MNGGMGEGMTYTVGRGKLRFDYIRMHDDLEGVCVDDRHIADCTELREDRLQR